MSARLRQRRGASAIEFGLTLPILLVICSAVIEYGMVFFEQSAIVGAVRDGTRFGVTIPLSDDPEGEAEDRARTVLSGYNLDCSNRATCDIQAQVIWDAANSYWYLQLTIERDYEPLLGLLPTPDVVGGQMVMLIEDQIL